MCFGWSLIHAHAHGGQHQEHAAGDLRHESGSTRDITVTSSLFATLNLISGGRMQLGIGRGDSSRRVLGKKPVTEGDLEEAINDFRNLTGGHEIDYEGERRGLLGLRAAFLRYGLRDMARRCLNLRGALAMASFCNSPIRI